MIQFTSWSSVRPVKECKHQGVKFNYPIVLNLILLSSSFFTQQLTRFREGNTNFIVSSSLRLENRLPPSPPPHPHPPKKKDRKKNETKSSVRIRRRKDHQGDMVEVRVIITFPTAVIVSVSVMSSATQNVAWGKQTQWRKAKSCRFKIEQMEQHTNRLIQANKTGRLESRLPKA